ncbi:MAG: glutamate-1-semialdehyde 2,1-aminomutase [Holophagae bacterium]|jgi:glutamate-1-semialdehyde 2,1-aminomutase
MNEHKRSHELYERACRVMPAGVNSPVRAFRSVGGEPFFYDRAQGCHVFDEDGNRYIDYVCSWGPLILGHAHPDVVDAVSSAAAAGLSFGAPCRKEVELAELVTSTIPFLDSVRFVSSGTEAVMSAIRLARGVTGRDAVIKFSGCYHGHADHLLVSAGSGLATFGTPSSDGVPASFAGHTIVLPLADKEAFERTMDERGDEIAAVIIEGVPANSGLLIQCGTFMNALREQCDRHGAMLILDEVITGFRLGPGGGAEKYGITPDLATYGKIIGGGMPVGAYGGSHEVMEHLAPLGPVYQAGTLSGNPVAMAAGLATLQTLLENDAAAYARLDALASRLQSGLQDAIDQAGEPWTVVRAGSILWLALQDGDPPRRFEDIEDGAAEIYGTIHGGLLDRGVSFAPSAYEVIFVSLAHDETVIDESIEAFTDVLGTLS